MKFFFQSYILVRACGLVLSLIQGTQILTAAVVNFIKVIIDLVVRPRSWSWSVSYTHLDVYKRQSQRRTARETEFRAAIWSSCLVPLPK